MGRTEDATRLEIALTAIERRLAANEVAGELRKRRSEGIGMMAKKDEAEVGMAAKKEDAKGAPDDVQAAAAREAVGKAAAEALEKRAEALDEREQVLEEREQRGVAADERDEREAATGCDCVKCRVQRGLDHRVSAPSGLLTDR